MIKYNIIFTLIFVKFDFMSHSLIKQFSKIHFSQFLVNFFKINIYDIIINFS